MSTTSTHERETSDNDETASPKKKQKIVSDVDPGSAPTKRNPFNSVLIKDDPSVDFTVQIRSIFVHIPSALPPATPVTLKRANQCDKNLETFDLATTIPVRETTIRCLNLALSDGTTKGKIKIYNLATIPARYLETGGRTSTYLRVKDDTRGLPSRFFSVIEITNSSITKLGDRIRNCQINSRMPKIWSERAISNITNGLRIDPKVYIATYYGGINFSTRTYNNNSTPGTDDFTVRRAIPFNAYDGRETLFSLSKLSSLPMLDGELCEGDIALVTFTVGFYPWEETETELKLPETLKSPRKIRREGYTTALSFNIQNVVLLYREEPTITADDEEENDDTLSDEPLF
ncbi:hypothetical protein M422DRAFT_254804 [Sphaerobolus stellatus SS14]|uniref:Uncharacterized protein n=1 Tax=Sphaerobolus stellatus (strain SS14) TaxID=990650 RepID=A0A0C9VV08_SPHS4|nr:hypothetical protein M422DRAFT_254804 [Sphaerobolus stellatus SS14]